MHREESTALTITTTKLGDKSSRIWWKIQYRIGEQEGEGRMNDDPHVSGLKRQEDKAIPRAINCDLD